MLVDRNAEEAGASLILADREQGAAEGRPQQQGHGAGRGREAEEDEVVERLVVARDVDSGEAEIERHPFPSGQTVVAAGQRDPAEGDEIEHLPERDRHHGEIDAAQPHDHRADRHRAERADDDADQQAERRAGQQYI